MIHDVNNRGERGRIPAGEGTIPADIRFLNAEVFNPFTGEWQDTDIAVKDGRVIGPGPYRAATEIDLKGHRVVPGLIDAHVHIESSLLSPPGICPARILARDNNSRRRSARDSQRARGRGDRLHAELERANSPRSLHHAPFVCPGHSSGYRGSCSQCQGPCSLLRKGGSSRPGRSDERPGSPLG